MSAWMQVARIVKTRNLEGGLVVQACDGLPFLLSEGSEVWFVPPSLRGVRHSAVESVSGLGADSADVRFSGVADVDAAEGLVGKFVLMSRAALPTDLEADVPPVGLEGWLVADEELGDLGRVVEVVEGAAQNLLVVEGPHGEVMIPLVEEFVARIDEDDESIIVSIPAGLVGLNDPGSPKEVSESDSGACSCPAADPSRLLPALRSAQGADAPPESLVVSAHPPFDRTAE